MLIRMADIKISRHGRLSDEQKDYLRNSLAKDGLQSCLKDANNNPEGVTICETHEQRLAVQIWHNTTETSSKQIANEALDKYREELVKGSFFYHVSKPAILPKR